MSIKLIATDLDGTLMSGDHMTITKYTLDVLKRAHDSGIKIAIATGRPLSLIGNVTSQIPFADYVIYANGACVYDTVGKKIIYSSLIDSSTARALISHFLTQRVFFEVYVDGRSQFQSDCEQYFIDTDFPSAFVEEVKGSMDAHEDLLEYLGDREIEKITLYCLSDEQSALHGLTFEKYDLSTACSFAGSLEATAKNANKGIAVKGLGDVLGIGADEIMCFGDAGNDIPMLEYAKYSFAMANGTEQCKKSARFIARANTEDGLARAVEEYALNKG